MIIYRPQRSSLADSMKEKREFDTLKDMKKYICNQWTQFFDGISLFTVEDIVLCPTRQNDNRIGWNEVQMVCVMCMGREDYIKEYGCPQCIGYCSDNY